MNKINKIYWIVILLIIYINNTYACVFIDCELRNKAYLIANILYSILIIILLLIIFKMNKKSKQIS